MATTLKAIIPSGSVAAGATAVLPHTLNVDGVGQVPDLVQVDNGSFSVISSDDTNVTVQNTGGAAASTNVYCESWYSSERTFGDVGVTALTPQPFVPAGGISGGVSASTFVYQPGGTAGGNVFTDWNTLMTALDSVRGLRTLEFDDSFVSPAVIPGNSFVSYDMLDVIWKAHNDGFVSVDLANNSSFTNLRNFVGNLTVRNLNLATSPVTDFAAFDLVSIDGASVECGTGAVPFFDLTAAGAAGFIVFNYINQGGIGLNPAGGVPVIELGVAGLTLFNNMGSGAGPQRNSISGPVGSVVTHQVTSHHSVLGPQPAFLGSTSIFVTHPAPRRNIVPGPGSTPFTGPATIAPGDVALGDASGGAFALTLETLPGGSFNSQGIETIVKEVSGSAGLTVAPGGTNTIDGVAAAIAVPAGGAVRVVSDGVSNWIQVH